MRGSARHANITRGDRQPARLCRRRNSEGGSDERLHATPKGGSDRYVTFREDLEVQPGRSTDRRRGKDEEGSLNP
jgi:hypothetical protein